VQVLAIFVVSRIVTTAMMLFFAAHQAANSWTGAQPDYLAFSQLWDSHWFYIVAVSGYPDQLPITDTGHIGENAWAFLPVYPWLVRGLSIVSWIPYDAMAVIVSVLSALGTALLAHRLFREAGFAPVPALGAVALFCANPVSAILQVGYAESLMLLLLTVSLLLLQRRRYWATVPFVVLMSFTRPSGLAFALAIGLHVVLRWVQAWRGRNAFPIREQVAAIGAAVVATIAGFAWVVIAGVATGSLSAYTDTELAWRSSYIGDQPLLPFAGWFAAASWWAKWVHLPGWLGIVVLVLGLVALVVVAVSPLARRLGPTIRIWGAAWFVYLLAVFFPQSSTLRLLLPAYPALGVFALSRRWVFVVAMLLCLVGQWWWIDQQWAVAGYDWTPP